MVGEKNDQRAIPQTPPVPPDVIRCAVWLYLRFTLSFRDVEEMLVKRGTEVSREINRYWVIKFGPPIAANLQRHRIAPTER